MNKVILIGRICTDIDARTTPNGTAVSTYRLGVERKFKKEGQPDADFLTCVAFGKTGEFAANYLRKGLKIAVEGQIQTRSYENKDGKKVYITEILVDQHEFCEKKNDSEGNNTTTRENAPQGNYGASGTYMPDAYKTPAETGYREMDSGDDLPF